jgi:WD40 repeat protein
MARKATVTPTWSVEPLPAEAATSYINSVDISRNGQRVICGTYYYDYNPISNHTPVASSFPVGVFCYNATGKLQWKDSFSATEGVYWVAISQDASWAASGGLLSHGSGFIRAYNAATGSTALNHTTNARVNRVAISGDGTYLVAGAGATYFFTRGGAVWSAPQVIPCTVGDYVVAVDISEDGQWIAIGTDKGFISLIRNVGGVLSPAVTWQQPSGSIYWVEMASGGSGFVAGAKNASVLFFSTTAFTGASGPTWTKKLSGCTRCGSVGISADGTLISAVGNSGKTGKVFLFQNQNTTAKSLWNAATMHNPNSTTLDAAGKYVTVADGQPDGTPGAFYLYDSAGNLKWSYATSNMSWPMQVSEDATGIAAGSDDANVYYFVV